MSKASIFTELRKARIERVLESKSGAFLTDPWTRRALSLVAIISSYLMLATLLIPTPYIISKAKNIYPDSALISKSWIYEARDFTQGVVIFLLIWCFIMLRLSMRKVTLLPDEYLDEMQITNRDWAFKTGYLVVRRIGLGVILLFGLLMSVGNQVMFGFLGNDESLKLFKAFERYLADLSMVDPFGFYLKGFLLLTFVAYAFPLILLAWREAKFPEVIPNKEEIKVLNENQNVAKFYFGALRWIVLSITLLLSCSLSPKVYLFIGPIFYTMLMAMVYLVIPGALMLYIWASTKVAKYLFAARKTGYTSAEQMNWANISTAFLTITQLLGLAVGYIMFSGYTSPGFGVLHSLPIALIAGLLMIPAQAISMMFYAKLESK